MNPQKSSNVRNKAAAIGIAFAVHLILFVILAVIVILPAIPGTPVVTAVAVSQDQVTKERDVVKPEVNTSVRTPSTVSNPLSVDAVAEISIARPEISEAPVGLGDVQLTDAAFASELASGAAGMFGSTTPLEGGLRGTFYDLKQTSGGGDSGLGKKIDSKVFAQIAADFVASRHNPSKLSKYYQAPNELYATQMFIPKIDADTAPQAFKVNVEPRGWLIHYTGRVSAPESAEYRFIGAADVLLTVALDNKVVLATGWKDIVPTLRQKLKWNPAGGKVGFGKQLAKLANFSRPLEAGQWVRMTAGQSVPFDMVIGERPGGHFYAGVFVQKKGEDGTVVDTVLTTVPEVVGVTESKKELELLKPLDMGVTR